MKKVIFEDKYGHGELLENHVYTVCHGAVVEINRQPGKN